VRAGAHACVSADALSLLLTFPQAQKKAKCKRSLNVADLRVVRKTFEFVFKAIHRIAFFRSKCFGDCRAQLLAVNKVFLPSNTCHIQMIKQLDLATNHVNRHAGYRFVSDLSARREAHMSCKKEIKSRDINSATFAP
jgi:hypothetical protein